MINNSWTWKNDLKNRTLLLKRNLSLRKRSYHKLIDDLELFLVQSAFSVRKLRDSKKLSDEAEKYEIRAEVLPLENENLFLKIIPHREFPYEYYSQSRKITRKINLYKLCDYLIHSFHLWFILDKNGNSRSPNIKFLVNSDHSERKLFEISFDDWFKALEYIYTDDIVCTSQTRNKETGRMEYTQKRRFKPF